MTIRRVLVVVTLLSLAAAAYVVYTGSNRPAAAANTPGAQTATVTRGNLIATVNSAGPVAARAQVMLSFGTGGTVKQVYAKLGDRVKQGQVLAELEATDLQLTLANALIAFNTQQVKFDQVKAGPSGDDLAAAQLSVENAQAGYDQAVRKAGLNDEQLLIYRAALDRSALSLQKAQSEYDKAVADRKTDLTALQVALQQAKLDYESAQANYSLQVANLTDSAVRSAAAALLTAKSALTKLQTTPTQEDLQLAQAQLDQSRISLQQAQYRMRNAQLVAPFDGIVTQVNIDQYFTAGASTQAIQISDLNKLQVTVNMAEVDIGKVKVGQDVNVTLDALPDRPTLTGKVDQIALVGVTTQGVVNYPVVIVLSSPDPSVIKTGMTANVAIIVDRRDNVLLVPNRAVRTVNRQRQVTLQGPAGVAVPTVVTIGLQNDTQSEVLSGLQEGQVVVIATTQTRPTTGQGGFGGPGGGPVFIGR